MDDEMNQTDSQSKFPDELSRAMGELSNYRSAQSEINARILTSLAKIEERLSGLNEVNATLTTYRGTLHERFTHLHQMLADMDEEIDKLGTKVHLLDDKRLDAHDKLQTRLGKLEIHASSMTFGLKVVYGLASITGPILGVLIPMLTRLMTK